MDTLTLSLIYHFVHHIVVEEYMKVYDYLYLLNQLDYDSLDIVNFDDLRWQSSQSDGFCFQPLGR